MTDFQLKDVSTEEKRWQKFYLGLLAGFILVVLVFMGLFSYRALHDLANDQLTLGVASLTGLPAGFVNSHRLSYINFQEDLTAVKHFYDFQSRQNPDRPSPSDQEIQKSVWDRLAKNILMEKMANSAKVAVSQKELNQEFENVVKDLGSPEAAAKMLTETYGWTAQQFKDKILYPFLLQEKLRKATSTIDLLKNEKKDNLEDYLNDLLTKVKIWKWIKI